MKDMLIDLLCVPAQHQTQLARAPCKSPRLEFGAYHFRTVCKLLLYMFVSIHLFSVFLKPKVLVGTCSPVPIPAFAFNSRTPER